MIRKISKLIAVFLCFTLEVKVHALELKSDCTQTEECLIKTERLEVFEMGGTEYRVLKGSVLKKISKDFAEVVTGKLLVNVSDHLKLKSLYGEVLIHNGSALIEVDRHKMQLSSVSGSVSYRGNGFDTASELRVGLFVQLHRVNESGRSRVDFPHLISKENLVQNWSVFYRKGESSRLQSLLQGFVKTSIGVSDSLSDTYVESIRREQASLDQQRENERLAKERKLKETEYLRDMFRRRALYGEYSD